MANEIVLSIALTVAKSGFKHSLNDQLQATQNALGESSGIMVVPTTPGGTVLPVGNVSTSGVIYLKNLDTTNYVQCGIQVSGTFYPLPRLNPGDIAVWRLDPTATLRLMANTASCNVAYSLFQD